MWWRVWEGSGSAGGAMLSIRKQIVTDEDMRPVAVQIAYDDWLEIERQLGLGVPKPGLTNLGRHRGGLMLPEDALEYQRRVRDKWRSRWPRPWVAAMPA